MNIHKQLAAWLLAHLQAACTSITWECAWKLHSCGWKLVFGGDVNYWRSCSRMYSSISALSLDQIYNNYWLLKDPMTNCTSIIHVRVYPVRMSMKPAWLRLKVGDLQGCLKRTWVQLILARMQSDRHKTASFRITMSVSSNAERRYEKELWWVDASMDRSVIILTVMAWINCMCKVSTGTT